MKKWLALLASVLALGIVAAGCGGSDDKGSSDGGSGGGSKVGSSGSGAKAAGEVVMKEISFKPGNVTIKAGQTVKWTNDEQAGHDVTATGGADKFKSGAPGALQMGDTFEHKFTKPGTVQYVCTVHSGMKGTIKVE